MAPGSSSSEAVTPPNTCTASLKPAFLTAANVSADRTPVLQYMTIWRSWGSEASASPRRMSSFGIKVAPGMRTISHSAGSRTSISAIGFSVSMSSLRSCTVIVDPAAASCASSDTTPQNAS